MKRIYWLLALVVVLALGFAALQFSSRGKEQGTYVTEKRDFKVAAPEEVSKVFLAHRDGKQTTLIKQNDQWLVNGEYPANENAISNLLEAIGSIEMQYIPTKAAAENIVKNLATEGILVQVFNAAGTKLKGYYIGGSTADERGTYAILEDSNDPFVVQLPGWVGNLRFRYNLVGDDWRSKMLFTHSIQDIELLSIEYPTRRNLSFVLTPKGDEFQIAPFYETDQPIRPVPRGRAERYLYKYEKLFISEYSNHAVTEKAALVQKQPFATIYIKLKDGEEMRIKAFPHFNERYITADMKTGEVIDETPMRGYDLLLNDDQDFAVVQTADFAPFLETYQSF